MPRTVCECADPGCPAHEGVRQCEKRAVETLYRVDMEDRKGIRFCYSCGTDALESGVFTD